jgi:hypothetical protein
MTVTTRSGRTLKFTFMHSSPFDANGHIASPLVPVGQRRQELDTIADISERRMTVCEVVEQTDAEVDVDGTADSHHTYTLLGQGMAICRPPDPFSKATGRKLSLTYALRAASFPALEPEAIPYLSREDRADVWAYYLKEFTKPQRSTENRMSMCAGD